MGISLKELKKNRLTPAEKWVLERIEGAKPETNEDGSVDWWKNGDWLFTQYFVYSELDVSHNVWMVLREEFRLSDIEIEELLSNLLYDYTNNGNLKVC